MVKSVIRVVAIAAAIASPVAVFAQSNQPLTRAQVRAELVQLEEAGYKPGLASPYYPADIQAAQARIAQQNDSEAGGSVNGASASGARAYQTDAVVKGPRSVYFGQ